MKDLQPNLIIKRINGEPTRFFVHSETTPGKIYLVEILAHPIWDKENEMEDWNGECNCKNFACTRIVQVKGGYVSRCKHIDACRNYSMNRTLSGYAQENNQVT